jgi:hypothetical protein
MADQQRDVIEILEQNHREVEETMQRLDKLDAADPALADELATLMAQTRHDIEDEEGEMFAHMRQVIDADDLHKLGAQVEAATDRVTSYAAARTPVRAATYRAVV